MFSMFYKKSDPDENAVKLLKNATKLKREGDISSAIKCLEDGYIEISKTSTDYTVDVFLRFPMYLQAANRFDDAWRELNMLLTHGYPNMSSSDWSWSHMESRVYDKMRLHLQREKKFNLAVTFGVLSHIANLRSEYEKPKKIKDLKYITASSSRENLKAILIPLLKKSKQLYLLDSAALVLIDWVKLLPDIKDGIYKKKFTKIININ